MKKVINKLKQNYSRTLSFILSICIIFNFIQVFPTSLNVFAEDTKEIIYGDINNDTVIDVLDIISLKNSLLYNKQVSIDAADVNGDDVVNSQDLLLIKEYVLGKISVFPIQSSKLQELVDKVNANRDIEIQMTSAMLSKTEELGTPTAVYEFVKNNVRNEFYYGSKKGAKGTFEELSGNNIDQASLLIAMLSYLGYTSTYASSFMKLSPTQAINWTCTDNLNTILNLFKYQTNNNVSVDDINAVSCIMPLQIWVQVEIDGIIYNLDPSFKQYEPQSDSISNKLDNYGIDTEEILESTYYYDEYDFNSTIKQYQSIISKYNKERAYINNNQITQVKIDELPTNLEYELVNKDEIVTFSSISNDFPNLSNRITFSLGTTWDDENNSKSITTAELYGKNIIIRYDNNSVPKLYINNELFLTFKSYGEETVYGVVPKLIMDTNLIIKTDSQLIDLNPDSIYSITLDYGNISSNALNNAYNDVFNVSKEVTENNVLETKYIGSFLHLAGVMYFSQLDIENYLLAQQYNVYQNNQCSICVTSYNSKNKNLCIDVPSVWSNVFNLSTPVDENDTTVRDYNVASSMISSKLEDTIWHELTGYESASTTNVFEEATRNNIELLMISSANIDTELLKLTYTDSVYNELKTTIQNEVSTGNIIIIPSTEININEWHGTGYISVNPTTGITTDKVLNRTTGTILGGGYSTKTVSLAILAECIFSIDGIVGSIYLIDAILVSVSTLNPVVGGLVIAYGAFCMASAIYNYINTLDLMYKYMNGDQYAGATLVENAVQDTVWTILSFGLNQAVKYVETPAVTSKYIDTYGYETTHAMSKGDPDFIAYPDGTILAMKGVYETTGNADNVTQLANIVSNSTPQLYKIVEDYSSELLNLSHKYNNKIISNNTILLLENTSTVLSILDDYGNIGANAIYMYGKNFINAYQSTTEDITEMLDTTFSIMDTIDIDKNLPLNEYHFDSILTLNNTDIDYIEKVSKSLSIKLAEMIREQKIKTVNSGKIKGKIVTVCIDKKTGKVYYGISGYKSNPTRRVDANNITITNNMLANMINNLGESLTNYPIDNCGEFNAINNALFDGASITDLCLYSINISNNVYWAPCPNCQSLYSSYVTFIK